MLAAMVVSGRSLLLLLFVALTACALPRRAHARPATGPVEYRVEIPAPQQQYVHVAMTVARPTGQRSSVALPAWTPGSYLVRDHARHLYDLTARDDLNRPVAVERLDKQTWRVEHGGRPFSVHYRIFAAEASVRTCHVDDRHASLVGASLFLYVVGELERPATVDIALPQGWSAHSALPSEPTTTGMARLSAPNYDALVDGPIELGTPAVHRFVVDGASFEYVLTGARGTAIDGARLAEDAKRVVRAQGEMMGGFPFSRYVFLMRVSEDGGGGLEHADSTSMMMRRRAFDRDTGYARAASLAAHEFFHLWNVKRIHDRVLGPFDYAHENHSRLLWFHEGFTETMEAHSLRRAGLVKPRAYVEELGRRWTAYLRKPGRDHDPIADLSFEAWTKGYRPAANHPNVAVSYYEKGDFLGVALDLELRLRAATKGREGSLLGVFVRLMHSHAELDRGITLADIVQAASAEAGQDMAWFFERHVEGTDPVDLPALVEQIGVRVRTGAPWLDDDGQPRAELDAKQRAARIFSGLSLTRAGAVRNVEPSSPAQVAGMMRDDEILAVDGLRADDRERVLARLAEHAPGDSVTLTVFRGGRLLAIALTLAQSPYRTHRLSLVPKEELTAEQRRLRAAWLSE